MYELLLKNQLSSSSIIIEAFQDASIENMDSLNQIISDLRKKYQNEKGMNIIFREIDLNEEGNIKETFSVIEGVFFIGNEHSKEERNITILREVKYEI